MNIYLVPARQENIHATINRGVSIDIAQRFLEQSDFERLSKELGDQKIFYCWAMTEGKRATFESMRAGDKVIMTLANTGLFNYVAEVIYKTDSRELGEYLWQFVPNDPWKLIYFLSDIRPINVSKSTLLTALDYDPTDHVSGVRRVIPEHLKRLRNYSSIHEFISSLEKGELAPTELEPFSISEVREEYFTKPHNKEEELTYEQPEWLKKQLTKYLYC